MLMQKLLTQMLVNLTNIFLQRRKIKVTKMKFNIYFILTIACTCSCHVKYFDHEESIILILRDTSKLEENYCEKICLETQKILFQKEYSKYLKNEIEKHQKFMLAKKQNMNFTSHSSTYCEHANSLLQGLLISSNYFSLNGLERSIKIQNDINKDSSFLKGPLYALLYSTLDQITMEERKSFFMQSKNLINFVKIEQYLILGIKTESEKEKFIEFCIINSRNSMDDSYFFILKTLIDKINLSTNDENSKSSFNKIILHEMNFLKTNKDKIPHNWSYILNDISQIKPITDTKK